MRYIAVATVAIILILATDAYREVCIIQGKMADIPEQVIAVGKYLITSVVSYFAGRKLRGDQ